MPKGEQWGIRDTLTAPTSLFLRAILVAGAGGGGARGGAGGRKIPRDGGGGGTVAGVDTGTDGEQCATWRWGSEKIRRRQ